VVKEKSKETLRQLGEQEKLNQQPTSQVSSKAQPPKKKQWLKKFNWFAPVLQEKTAPLQEKITSTFPNLFKKENNLEPVAETDETPTVTYTDSAPLGVDPLYRKYRCLETNPLGCEWTQKTLEQEPESQYCVKCNFPVIFLPKTELRGYKGRYKVESYIGHRGKGRLYRGIQAIDQQTVIIKEFPLPNRCFNPEETRQRKQSFERLTGLSLADGRIQDIRLIVPWDAFCDPVSERCYLVTNSNLDAYPTLGSYLATNGAMNTQQVRRVLEQVLQTLQFLHGQKFRLPSGDIQQGIAHGNISLDSLLINSLLVDSSLVNSSLTMAEAKDFFIHVCDLALWEKLFNPPMSPITTPTKIEDLKALGYVAFYLLTGDTVYSETGEPLDPLINKHWGSVEPSLKAFILRLLEFDKPFASAEEARITLLQLPPFAPAEARLITAETEIEKAKPKTKLLRSPIWLFGILGLLLLGSLLWLVFQKLQEPPEIAEEVTVCCLKDVPAVPPGNFTYTGERKGIWSYILRSTNLILKNQTLEEKLKESQPKLQLNFQPEDLPETALAKVQSGKVDFGVTSLVNDLTPQMLHREVAYDGLVVFVAFSYAKRESGLPKALNGKISLEQLRELYTGKITNWQQLGGADLPVKLYFPPEKEAVRIFEQRVLKDKNAIMAFRNLLQQQKANQSSTFITSNAPPIQTLPTLTMLQQVLRDFEESNIGSIGFATLSQVFGQCSAYPLALVDGNRPAVQTLIQDNGKDVEPSTDLCNDKGRYQPNVQVFKSGSYPLGYPIVVVYPADNSRTPIGQKFADMLRTSEVQQLLGKAGLVPITGQK
jgi:ABC-type phosphate transport system substrate-binding protein